MIEIGQLALLAKSSGIVKACLTPVIRCRVFTRPVMIRESVAESGAPNNVGSNLPAENKRDPRRFAPKEAPSVSTTTA